MGRAIEYGGGRYPSTVAVSVWITLFLGISVQAPVLFGIDLLRSGNPMGAILVGTGVVTLGVGAVAFRWLQELRRRGSRP